MEIRKTLFISDLHLSEKWPLLAQKFFDFLDSCDASVDSLYILGDLFEAWLGDDDQTTFPQSVLNALKETTKRGIPIYLIHGNRDFLLGSRFAKASGCQILPEIKKINLYGDDVLLLHGDTLCTLDVAYIKVRKYLRNPWLQKLFFLSLPLNFRQKIATNFRARSQLYTSTAEKAIMDVTPNEVLRLMIRYDVKNMIHGHTHRRAIHEVDLSDKAYRFVLGAWEEFPNVLSWDNTGKKEFHLWS